MKYLIQVFLLIICIGCSNFKDSNGERENAISQEIIADTVINSKLDSLEIEVVEITEAQVIDICPENIYSNFFSNSIIVEAKFKECEKNLKYKLIIKKDGAVIYKADSLLVYVFNDYEFPTYIHNANFEYILVERNNNHFLNKTDVFRIKENRVDSIYSIPNFQNQGMDIDNDGKIEYWNKLSLNNKNSEGKTIYNPILAYEIGEDILQFDSLITIELNKRAYGDFYGVERIDTLIFDNI